MDNLLNQKSFKINDIIKILPHRYPFILIDRIDIIEKGKSLIALKNMTINEKMLVYLFLDKIVLERKIFVRKCNKCKFEWFSTDCDAIHCEKCR